MTFDPNAPNPEPSPAPEPAPEPQPAPPEISVDQAADIISQHYGYDPRLAKYEFEELKRKRDEQEAFDRELKERERRLQSQAYQPPQPQFNDPVAQMLYETRQEQAQIRQMLLDERAERAQERERQAYTDRMGTELERTYVMQGRQRGMSMDQIKAQQTEFFMGAMTQLYPAGVPAEVGVENAVRNTFQYMNGNGNGHAMRSTTPTRPNPRQTLTVPVDTSPAPAVQGPGGAPIRGANETNDQWTARIERYFSEKYGGVPTIADGMRNISNG